MNDNVIPIRTGTSIDVQLALEELLRDLKTGKVRARRCVIVLADHDLDGEAVAVNTYGESAQPSTWIGLLELAKHDIAAAG